MKSLVLSLLFLVTGISGNNLATAQVDDCPKELICVDYEEYTLELNPECGVVQAVVIEESLARSTTLNGVEETFGVRGVVVSRVDGVHSVIGEVSGPATDTLEGVRFQDTGCIEWQVENDSE